MTLKFIIRCHFYDYFILCILFSTLSICNTQMYAALSNMERIFEAENKISILFKNYIKAESDRLTELQKIASDFEVHSKAALSDPLGHIGNPVSAFLLVKRFTTDWEKKVEPLLNTQRSEAIMKHISEARTGLPSDEDYDGAAAALLRLQDTYKLSCSNISHGKLPGVRISPTLNARDCYDLARTAYSDDDFYHAVMWFQETMGKLDEESIYMSRLEYSNFKADVLDHLAFSLFKQGNIGHASVYTDELVALMPNHERGMTNKRFFDKNLAAAAQEMRMSLTQYKKNLPMHPPKLRPELVKDEYRVSNDFKQYEGLCRGEDLVPNPYTHKLICRYVHNFDPRLRIKPVKEEELYLNPRVVVLRDFMSDTEIEVVKKNAAPNLQRATIIDPITAKQVPAFYRVSKSAWLTDETGKEVARLSSRMNAYSKISLKTVEELQVQNYGVGGQYEPHYDFARSDEKAAFEEWRGNRIATFLLYMTDVEAGGATVFIHLGIKAFPIKGDTVFWFNLLTDNDGDLQTRHAGCPVLVGSKWVSNKWFHVRDNEFELPCDCHPGVPFKRRNFPQTYAELRKSKKRICKKQR